MDPMGNANPSPQISVLVAAIGFIAAAGGDCFAGSIVGPKFGLG